jgi:mRNA interferase MazF
MSSPPTPFPRRGEVYWLNFDPSTGHEMSGPHPCIIVQNDVGNRHSDLTIVVAVTSNLRVASLPIGVLLRAGQGGLPKDSAAHCGHVYAVDKARLGSKVGDLPAALMREVDKALARSPDLPNP